MKASKAPKKIYLQENTTTDCYGEFWPEWFEARAKDSDIEYVRKDVFKERVCDWLSDTLQTVVDVNIPSAHHVESIPALGIITQPEFIEKFKKEIEYLLD